jgi:hypothetical protein
LVPLAPCWQLWAPFWYPFGSMLVHLAPFWHPETSGRPCTPDRGAKTSYIYMVCSTMCNRDGCMLYHWYARPCVGVVGRRVRFRVSEWSQMD